MKKMNKLALLVVVLFALISCENNESKNATLSVKLTDAPADYEEVLIDIQEVRINVSTEGDKNGWISLENTNAGIYNLLDFTNGLDTLLVEQDLPPGKISQMRLVLGTNNQLKKAGKYYTLETPSSQQSGLKFNIHATLVEGITYKMWIDFDAGRSIIEKGNGRFSLKPVIRTYTEATSGAIKGVISPVNSKPYIIAISSMFDTLGTYADTISGQFLIGGVPTETYEVQFKPIEGFATQVEKDITVIVGEVADMDTVRLENIQ